LRHDAQLRAHYGQVAYEAALRKFTAERMVKEYEQVYQEISSTAKVA
jgi:hypothetical protein